MIALTFSLHASAADNACDNVKGLVNQMHEISIKIVNANANNQEVDMESELSVLTRLRQAYEQAKPYCNEQVKQKTCPVLNHI